jgi:hypothetical protein
MTTLNQMVAALEYKGMTMTATEFDVGLWSVIVTHPDGRTLEVPVTTFDKHPDLLMAFKYLATLAREVRDTDFESWFAKIANQFNQNERGWHQALGKEWPKEDSYRDTYKTLCTQARRFQDFLGTQTYEAFVLDATVEV